MQTTLVSDDSGSNPRYKPVDRPFEKPRRVVVFDGDAEGNLVDVLDQLSYRADNGTAGAADMRNGEQPIAAIVSDAVAAPLDLCATLSVHHKVLLLSNDDTFQFRLDAAKAGVTALIRRPVNPLELSEWLGQFVGETQPQAISILIVDDDRLMSELNADVLRAAGMAVRIVNDPTLALQALENDVPDLVLMDVRMPGVDGIELTRVFRQSRHLVSLPIIFLSVERDKRRQMTARRLGGDDFIVKPVDPNHLISLVRLRAERSKSLRTLIERDRLTGLYDHGRFKECLSQELDRCRRAGSESSLVMVDVDNFKQINDRFGHPVGDIVIRTLASSLTASLRRTDILGRCGGEEFGAVLLDTTPADAKLVMDRFKDRFSRIVFGGARQPFSVTFSAGVASSRDNLDSSELLAASDFALYEAKRSGRNRVQIASAP